MTTDPGRAFAMARLSQAPDLEALKTVWGSLGITYQRDADIAALKDQLKAQMEARQ